MGGISRAGIGAWYDDRTKQKYVDLFEFHGLPPVEDITQKFRIYGYDTSQTSRSLSVHFSFGAGEHIVRASELVARGVSVGEERVRKPLFRKHHMEGKMTVALKGDRRRAYDDLIIRLAAHGTGLDSAHMMNGGPFMYGRWLTCLTYEPELALDCAILHMDLGPLLTRRDAASAAVALLESNHESCMQRRGFSLSPVTGHIIYSEALVLDDLSIDDLLMALERSAQRVAHVVEPD